MQDTSIVFDIDQDKKIVIELDDPIESIGYLYWVSVYFVIAEKRYLLKKDVLFYCLQCLEGVLKKALANKLTANYFSSNDWGLWINENFVARIVPNGIEEDQERERISSSFLVWSADYIFWLCNNDKGEIIFGVSPGFPGSMVFLDDLLDDPIDQEVIETLNKYQVWVKDYRPVLIQKLDYEKAKKWLNKAEVLLRKIQGNIERASKSKEN